MADYLYYFAYGSNINPKVLESERCVKPVTRVVAHLKNHALIFNVPGIQYFEPAFANIMPCDGSDVWGVCYQLSSVDFDKIRATEGSIYKTIDIDVYPIGSNETISAITLASDAKQCSTRHQLWPSSRYLQILISGAEYHRLPANYIAKLSENHSHHLPIFSGTFNFLLKMAKPVWFFIQRNGLRKK